MTHGSVIAILPITVVYGAPSLLVYIQMKKVPAMRKPLENAPKTRRRKDARPGEIIEAAMTEFAQQGFERAKLDAIAKAAGISKGTIYLYFDSKEALFEQAIKTYVLAVMDAADADISAMDGSTEVLLRKLVERIYNHMVGSHATTIMRILILEGDRFPDLVQLYHDTAISKGIRVLKRFLARGIARGEIEETAMTKVPELLIAPTMFFAINQMVFSAQKPLDRGAFFEGHVDMIVRALRPCDRRSNTPPQ